MGLIEVVLSVGVCVVTVVAIVQIIKKAGYSGWWVLVPLTPPILLYSTLAVVRTEAAFGALNVNTLVNTQAVLLAADAFSIFVAWVFFVIFAFSRWPSLRQQKTISTNGNGSAVVVPPSARLLGPRRHVAPPLVVRPLPDVEGQPAGWFPTGAMGSGEQTYWDGSTWTARRVWRNEMWIDLPMPVVAGGARV